MLLDELLPQPDVDEVHETWIGASPEAAWAAVRAVTPVEIRLLLPLMALRVLPGLLARGRVPGIDLRAPVVDGFVRNGFVLLAERPGEELVVGACGRFWQLRGAEGVLPVGSAASFAAFAQPASARSATSFTVRPEAGGACVRTETRVAGTDAEGTRAFSRYWRVIAPGSAAIRLSWLNAIRRRAVRDSRRRSPR